MALGRCAGCGDESTLRASQAHISRCPKFAVLYRTDPSKALDPVAEYRRVAAVQKSEPVVAKARVAAPKVSDPVARVVPAPKPEPVRQAGPVNVEYWKVPDSL